MWMQELRFTDMPVVFRHRPVIDSEWLFNIFSVKAGYGVYGI